MNKFLVAVALVGYFGLTFGGANVGDVQDGFVLFNSGNTIMGLLKPAV